MKQMYGAVQSKLLRGRTAGLILTLEKLDSDDCDFQAHLPDRRVWSIIKPNKHGFRCRNCCAARRRISRCDSRLHVMPVGTTICRPRGNKGTGSLDLEREAAFIAVLHAHRSTDVEGHTDQYSFKEPETSTIPRTDSDVVVVDWDGPHDPQNPKNWSRKQKWMITLVVSSFTFISPVSSSMVAPAASQVVAGFEINNSVITSLSTSIFILAYAIGSLFAGPLSEIFGRSRVLQLANLWYLPWNLACGFARTEGQLLAFRFLAGLGGSAPLSIGSGVLSDCWRPEERGQAIALYSLAPLLGPVIGPITGAWVAERSTWRWVFWATSLADVVVQVLGFFLLKETYAPVLLERKANKLRKSMDAEKGSRREVRTIFDSKDRSWQTILSKSLPRPFVLFARERIVQVLGLYMAYLYGTLYLFLVTIPSLFEDVYKQPTGIAGLNYVALGIGLTGASQLNARMMDKIYLRLKNRNGGVGRPEFRLPAMFLGSIMLPIGLLISGWTATPNISWIAPDIGIVFVGAGMVLSFVCIQAYIVDAFPLHAASASAAICCLRSLAAFGFPLFAPAMYSTLGFGKGDTILAVVAIVIGCPVPWVIWHYGERIRKSSPYAR